MITTKGRPPTGEQTVDGYGHYLHSIGREPLLNVSQEIALAKDIEAGVFAKTLLSLRDETTREQTQEQMRTNMRTHRDLIERNIRQRPVNRTPQKWTEIKDDEAIEASIASCLQLALQSDPQELAEMVDVGDAAFWQFVLSNLRLVSFAAKKFRETGLLRQEDDVAAGHLGLMRAVQKFDWTSGYKFSTLGVDWIRKYILEQREQSRYALPYTRDVTDHLSKVRKQFDAAWDKLGRAPTRQELAALTGLEEKAILRFFDLARVANSLDEALPGHDDTTLMDVVSSKATTNNDDSHRLYAETLVDDAVAELDPDEQALIRVCFLQAPHDVKMTDGQLAQHLGLESWRDVRRVRSSALRKLRRSRFAPLLAELAVNLGYNSASRYAPANHNSGEI